MTIHVKVLQHHIDQGEPRNMLSCPIVQALREQYPDIRNISASALITIGDEHWFTPNIAGEFMCDFDLGLPVGPFEFDLAEEHRWFM